MSSASATFAMISGALAMLCTMGMAVICIGYGAANRMTRKRAQIALGFFVGSVAMFALQMTTVLSNAGLESSGVTLSVMFLIVKMMLWLGRAAADDSDRAVGVFARPGRAGANGAIGDARLSRPGDGAAPHIRRAVSTGRLRTNAKPAQGPSPSPQPLQCKRVSVFEGRACSFDAYCSSPWSFSVHCADVSIVSGATQFVIALSAFVDTTLVLRSIAPAPTSCSAH
jgi:hypothetical protein